MSGVVRREVTVVDPLGLHARAAAAVVAALGAISGVVIRTGERVAPVQSVLALMGLGVRGGDAIVVEGPVEAGSAIDVALASIPEVMQAVAGGSSDTVEREDRSSS